MVDLLLESPRLVSRRNGGWLALSPPACDLRIAVTAQTPEIAIAKYETATIEWRRTIASEMDAH
jgi:hypothetical protein